MVIQQVCPTFSFLSSFQTVSKPGERIGDLAAGTCGFLVNAYEHILVKHTSPEILEINGEGQPHNFIGDKLTDKQREHLQGRALRGFDNDSGMTMLRIGSMNLMLHGIASPQYFYMDTLSEDFSESREYDVILMNPPFKGKVSKDEVNEDLPSNTTKSELLFVHLILRALDMGGCAAVIVPDGVLFGSSRAHVELRAKLVEENRLDGVLSMPSGVFKPYAGVSTAVLFFTRGARTREIWFYDMAHDGFSLDDKRQPVSENDIPDVLDCWKKRNEGQFLENREQRIVELREELAPLKEERMDLWAQIDDLSFQQFVNENIPDYHPLAGGVSVDVGSPEEVNPQLTKAKAALEKVETQIAPLQSELEQLSRQFWMTAEQVRQNKYDLSASRYREQEPEERYLPDSDEILRRLSDLNEVMKHQIFNLFPEFEDKIIPADTEPESTEKGADDIPF